MRLIVGLGNPGKEYEKTRHNVGFLALDAFATKHGFPEFRMDKKSNALLSDCVKPRFTQSDILTKPQTFMNNSGEAVKSLLQFYKIPPVDLIVIHDELDIPLGTVKVSRSSGSAGHKGVESIFSGLGTQDFTRIRVGISPTDSKPADVEKFVLRQFLQSEKGLLDQTLHTVTGTLESLLDARDKQTTQQ